VNDIVILGFSGLLVLATGVFGPLGLGLDRGQRYHLLLLSVLALQNADNSSDRSVLLSQFVDHLDPLLPASSQLNVFRALLLLFPGVLAPGLRLRLGFDCLRHLKWLLLGWLWAAIDVVDSLL
jgi:hypothetical protein